MRSRPRVGYHRPRLGRLPQATHPAEAGGGTSAWNDAGVWDQLHVVLLKKLRAAKKLDWSRAVIDSSHVRAARRAEDDPVCRRPDRTAAEPTRQPARRPRLRPRQIPPSWLGVGHPTGDRPPRSPARFRHRSPPVGRGADHRLAPRLPPPTDPMGTTRRHPRSLPRPRHLPHHPPPRPTPLLGPLGGRSRAR